MSRPEFIQVYADWKGLGGPQKMGTLQRQVTRGKEVLSFGIYGTTASCWEQRDGDFRRYTTSIRSPGRVDCH